MMKFCSNKMCVVLVGQRDKSGLLETSPTKSTSSGSFLTDAFNGSPLSIQTPSGVLCNLEEEEEEEILNNDTKETYTFKSRLSKALPEILMDKSALGYFIQFMDIRKHLALIKFWLEVECLCSASEDAEKAGLSNQKELLDALPTNLDDNKNFSCNLLVNNVNTQTSSEIPFDESADNSDNATSILNGMPKTSQAVSEARQSNHDCGSKRRHDVTTTRQDALRIYKKYILKGALCINQISEELRLEMEKAVEEKNIEPILRCLSTVQSIVYDILENE